MISQFQTCCRNREDFLTSQTDCCSPLSIVEVNLSVQEGQADLSLGAAHGWMDLRTEASRDTQLEKTEIRVAE